MNSTSTRAAIFGVGVALAITAAAGLTGRASDSGKPAVQKIKLTMDPSACTIDANAKIRLGYMPIAVTFLDAKPAAITKEPAYKGTPKYAQITLGNGPKSTYNLVFDEPEVGDWKVYLDKNQNGDLTDDGDGAWAKKTVNGARTVYGVNNYVLQASYGTSTRETSHAEYGIGLYRINTIKTGAFMFREAARTGEISVDGKSHKMILVENDTDALFNKTVPTDAAGKPVGKILSHPLWMIVDLKDTGKFVMADDTMFDVRAPFKLGSSVYEAAIATDGSSLTLTPTTKVAAVLAPPRPQQKPLLTAGTAVPDFRAEAFGGGTVQPADYKGKVLILDFWATWCGPCQKSMPHIERVYKAVKEKNVAVLAVCVWDDKDSYTKWVPAHQSAYTFPLAFDPAGKDTPNSIATKQFNVNGIPTTYVIGPDGKVADAIVGYSDGDTRLESALKKLGVEVSEAATK